MTIVVEATDAQNDSHAGNFNSREIGAWGVQEGIPGAAEITEDPGGPQRQATKNAELVSCKCILLRSTFYISLCVYFVGSTLDRGPMPSAAATQS